MLPHHERADPETVAAELAEEAPPEQMVLGIDAMTACFGVGDGWRVLGPGSVTVYEGGAWHRYAAGESVPIGG